MDAKNFSKATDRDRKGLTVWRYTSQSYSVSIKTV